MNKMKTLNADAYHWLEKMAPNTWVRAFFAEFPKCDLLLNNNCEVFNKYILESREMPVLSMLEKIKQQLMSRYYTKKLEVADFVGQICPKIRKKVAKNSDMANICYVVPCGQGVFQVTEMEFKYIVNIQTKECECRKWNLTGIPCQHAITCLRHERIPAESMVHDCYSVQTFAKAYEANIFPCRDKRSWEHVTGPQVLPPKYEKKVGRPPRCRRKQPYEVEGENGSKLSKHGVIITCSYCKREKHNAKGCFLKETGIRPEDYIEGEEPIEVEPPQPSQQEVDKPQPLQEVQDGTEQGAFAQFFSQDGPPVSSQIGTQEAAAPSFVDLTQHGTTPTYSQLLSTMSSTMLLHMMEQGSHSALSSKEPSPLLESSFISSNRPVERPAPLITATHKGKAAMKKRKTVPVNNQGSSKKKKKGTEPQQHG